MTSGGYHAIDDLQGMQRLTSEGAVLRRLRARFY
jgi:hypothetical protein